VLLGVAGGRSLAPLSTGGYELLVEIRSIARVRPLRPLLSSGDGAHTELANCKTLGSAGTKKGTRELV